MVSDAEKMDVDTPKPLYHCDECIDLSQANATTVCKECISFLCLKHADMHQDSKATHTHQLIPSLDIPEELELALKRKRFNSNTASCDLHPQCPAELFCVACNSIVCIQCQNSRNHYNHPFKRIFDCWEAIVEPAKNNLKVANDSIKSIQDGLLKIEDYRNYLKKDHLNHESQILEEYDRLKLQMDNELKEFQEKLRMEYEKTVNLYNSKVKELQNGIETIVAKQKDFESFLSNQDIVYLLEQFKERNLEFLDSIKVKITPELDWSEECGLPAIQLKKRREISLLESKIHTGLCMKESELLFFGFKPDNIMNSLSIGKILPIAAGDILLDQAVFTWPIEDWQAIKTHSFICSPEFKCNGLTWYRLTDNRKMLLYPTGNNKPNYFSLYLESVEAYNNDLEVSCIPTKYTFVSCNYDNEYVFKKYKDLAHKFTTKQKNWGYNGLDKEVDLQQKQRKDDRPIMENNKIKLKVYLNIVKEKVEREKVDTSIQASS
ncbi:hypothetical protein HDV04_000955 [Boothiomyces sp. JEL0838]|nr:hypothetical protein HDV04_000955 [Boothiomyces sp. JEL0838]